MGEIRGLMMRALIYSLMPVRGSNPGYLEYCLSALRNRYGRVIVLICGDLAADAVERIHGIADEVIRLAPTKDIDDSYRDGLQKIGWQRLAEFDEVTLMSSDLFGPLFPPDEMFGAMDSQKDLDIWSIAESGPLVMGHSPVFLDTNMITFRGRILKSPDFQKFWSLDVPGSGASFPQQVKVDQAKYLDSAGYAMSAYLQRRDFETPHPLYLEMPNALKKRHVPFLAMTPFCREPWAQDEWPSDLNQVLPFLAANSSFPIALFWETVLRRASLRTIHTNLAYQFTFDSRSYGKTPEWQDSLRIAVCAHVYYPNVLDEILDRAKNIPTKFDLYITTASPENKALIEASCAQQGIAADVRVVGQNRGRDMSSLFIDLKDVVLDRDYDLICRLHSKKSPQVNSATGKYFKNFVFDSVLATREYTSHLLDFLVSNPHVGMAFAPLIHTGYATMGHAWFENRQIFSEIISELGYDVPHEHYSPVAAYGTVYWFRPDALRPMFENRYRYEQYNMEPNHTDGGLAHGQERAMSYIAQARGYMSATVWPDYVAAQSTTFLEYKADTLYSYLPWKHIAPHGNLLNFLQNRSFDDLMTWRVKFRTPKPLRDFEQKHRSKVKKVAKLLGISKKKRHSTS